MRSEDLPPNLPGTYVLLLYLLQDEKLVIGMLGERLFPTGNYAYIGSAHGPGGLAGRIWRHVRPREQKPSHWHIDHFLQAAEIRRIWWIESEKKLECAWAQSLTHAGFMRPPGFGATDCHCGGHLLWLGEQEGMRKAWSCLQSETLDQINQIKVHPTIDADEG